MNLKFTQVVNNKLFFFCCFRVTVRVRVRLGLGLVLTLTLTPTLTVALKQHSLKEKRDKSRPQSRPRSCVLLTRIVVLEPPKKRAWSRLLCWTFTHWYGNLFHKHSILPAPKGLCWFLKHGRI